VIVRIGAHRGLRRSLFSAAAACLVLAAVAPGARARSGSASRPDVFAGNASAAVASVGLEPPGLLPIGDLFTFITLDGEATFESSNQEARASLVFPGNGLIMGPSLLCMFLPAESAPPELGQVCSQYSYPFTVFADSLRPDQSTDGSIQVGTAADPLAMRAAGARAHAAPDGVTTDAEVSDLRVLGAPALGALPIPGLDASVLRIEDASARTRQFIDENGALVVEATATLSGIALAGGVVRIGAMTSTARLVDPAGGDPTPETSVEVSGVTVAGTPAQITEDGLVLGTPQSQSTGLLDQVSGLLTDAVGTLGIHLTVLPEESEVTAGGASEALVGGLLIEMSVPVTGLPPVPTPIPGFAELDLNGLYSGSIQLGRVGVSSLASTFPDRVAPLRSVPAATTGSGGGVAPRTSSSSSGASAGAPAAAPAAPQTAAAPDAAAPEVAGVVDDLLADRMALLYLSFTLAALACCIAPRLTLPARLPGTSMS
jgi:hypothetical protein